MSGASAVAHPNIALVKYWGKVPDSDNLPATPSLSITLSQFESRCTVSASRDSKTRVRLNGAPTDDAKLLGWLERVRNAFTLPPLRVAAENNFPTGAGLASSAAGFAALITALDAAFGLSLDNAEAARWARLGSGSAARSMLGGVVALAGPDWVPEPLLDPDSWPLEVVVAVTSTARKPVGSTAGMEATANTSPYYGAWLDTAAADFDAARTAVADRDFDRLAGVTESSCLKMHAVMLTTRPALIYWLGATVDCLQAVARLRAQGLRCCFTVDAGPQVKVLCMPEAVGTVRETLAGIGGVQAVHVVGLGGGPRVL